MNAFTFARTCVCLFFAAIALLCGSKPALAQTDEIQVYDAGVAEPGKVNVMLHSNYTPIGSKTPAFPGGIVPDESVNGAVEWAWGVKSWFEQGLYLPVYTAYSKGRGGSINGFKIRELFAVPNAGKRKFFYGANFEFSVNYSYWESRRISSELRPIVGVHLRKIDLIYNPIVDTDYLGGFGGLEYVPATRIAYNLNERWSLAAEEYSEFGPLRHFASTHDQAHQAWAVLNHDGKFVSIETGVGVGFTSGADRLTFKFMISRDLN